MRDIGGKKACVIVTSKGDLEYRQERRDSD